MSGPLQHLRTLCGPVPLRGGEIRTMAIERDDLADSHRPDTNIEDYLRSFAHENPKILLFGSRGCGKSTELSRIESRFQKQFLIVGLDLGKHQVDLEKLSPEELLLLIGLAVARAADLVWSLDLSLELKELNRVIKPLLPADTPLKLDAAKLLKGMMLFGSTLVAGGAAPLVKDLFELTSDALAWDIDLGGLLLKTQDRGPGRSLLEVVNQIIRRVASYRPPLILVDELDKIEDPKHTFNLLTRHELLLGLECAVVLAAPNSLFRRRLDGVYHMTASLYHVRCWHYQTPDRADEGGLLKLQEVIKKRIQQLEVPHEDVISPVAERLLLSQCGGVVRDLVRLVQLSASEAIKRGAAQIGLEHANTAVSMLRRRYESALTSEGLECLKLTARTREIPGSKLATDLFHENLLLSYSSEVLWYFPHAILLGRLGLE